MSKILVKKEFNKSKFLAVEEQVRLSVNVTPTAITSKLEVILGNAITVISDWTLPFSIVKDVRAIVPNSLVSLSIIPNDREKKVLSANNLIVISPLTYLNRSPNTRNPIISSLYTLDQPATIQILVRNPEGSFDDCDVIVFTKDEYNFTTSNEQVSWNGDVIPLLDKITVTKEMTYDDAEYFKYKITTAPYVKSVDVHARTGILDKVRINLTNGVGYVRGLKSSVEGSDKISFKVGHLNYLNIVSFTDPNNFVTYDTNSYTELMQSLNSVVFPNYNVNAMTIN
jgi:hypothetical protein